ncbi:hypothetical protein K7X08_015566 [Anisodus acutangulus]|uniref:Uncharacterized protein n=1 Tax=Anisodus acutangulus TaxID=402998 RepID=A0A9Q1L643_9SOLA|nr:hypothetical protein K7X08_015566 [Anisodus acutangulus]
MPHFLPHQISPPNKLVVLNQTCLDLPTTSSERRKWGDEEEEEVADNEESPGGLQKGKAPMESQIADDMTESTEDNGEDVTDEEADGDKVEEEEMEVEEEESDDATVEQPGQIIAQEDMVQEPSPIAIEAFFERVRTLRAKKKKLFEWETARERDRERIASRYRRYEDYD